MVSLRLSINLEKVGKYCYKQQATHQLSYKTYRP